MLMLDDLITLLLKRQSQLQVKAKAHTAFFNGLGLDSSPPSYLRRVRDKKPDLHRKGPKRTGGGGKARYTRL